jgi:hypothetical protein
MLVLGPSPAWVTLVRSLSARSPIKRSSPAAIYRHGYVVSVLDAYRTRAISSLDVSDYLDVRFDKLDKLERVVFR